MFILNVFNVFLSVVFIMEILIFCFYWSHRSMINNQCTYHYKKNVSSSTMLIFRRTNCIITASGIVTLCKWPYSIPVQSGLQSALNLHTVRPLTESDDTRGCNNTICPPEDEHSAARNMLRVII